MSRTNAHGLQLSAAVVGEDEDEEKEEEEEEEKQHCGNEKGKAGGGRGGRHGRAGCGGRGGRGGRQAGVEVALEFARQVAARVAVIEHVIFIVKARPVLGPARRRQAGVDVVVDGVSCAVVLVEVFEQIVAAAAAAAAHRIASDVELNEEPRLRV